jgi:type IV pilus assembly protein PilB
MGTSSQSQVTRRREIRRTEAGHESAETIPRARPQNPSTIGRRFADLIVSHGLVTQEQFERALAEQKRTNGKLGEIMVHLGLITEDQLVEFFSHQYGIAVVTCPETIAPEIIKVIPARIARKYGVLPIERTSGSVTLAVADPTNLLAVDDVAFLTGLKVTPVIVSPSVIREAIERHYGAALTTVADVLSEVEAEAAEVEVVDGAEPHTKVDLNELRSSADQVPVVRLVNSILLDAIRRGASDVHLDPGEGTFRVRLRVDGMLHDVMTAPKRVESAVISRIKIMANLDIAERRLPQDGRIKLRQSRHEVDVRVSVLPSIFGESVTLRLLDKNTVTIDVSQLGLEAEGLTAFYKAIRSAHGMILITGPTGAGKTTTLYAALHAVSAPDHNIVTVEDPVEYEISGITQVQVNEEIGRTFPVALRSFLRHDPDVILVGEMRDQETAQIAVRAALTGHLVLTTLHTNNAAQTLSRLQDMGVPAFLVASALRLVVAQRLARKVCQDCREPYETNEESLVQYGHVLLGLGHCTLYKGKGCASCHYTGMKGRVGLFEVLPVSPEIRPLILNNTFAGEIQDVAAKQGMKTLREVGLLKVLQGLTTIEEILRVTAD